jgi:hypothetical protein
MHPIQPCSFNTEEEDRLSDSARKLHRYILKLKWTNLHKTLALLQSQGNKDNIRTSLTQCNRHGQSPLHAIAKDAPAVLIREMLQLIPSDERKDYLLAVDNCGNTPLHSLCQNAVTDADAIIVNVMASTCPQAMGVRNNQGDTPLHLFVASRGYLECDDVCLVERARMQLQRGTGPLGVYGMSSSNMPLTFRPRVTQM